MFEMRTSWGEPFPLPRLLPTGGILVGDYCYHYDTVTQKVSEEVVESDGKVERTVKTVTYKAPKVSGISAVFDTSYSEVVDNEAYSYGLRILAGTRKNLLAFAGLPFVDVGDAIAAIEYVAYFEWLRKHCYSFLEDKAAAMVTPAPELGPVHRRPAKVVSASKRIPRKLTVTERKRLADGHPIETHEVVVETSVQPVYQEWYAFAKSKIPFSQQVLGAEYLYRWIKLRRNFDFTIGSRLPTWYTPRVGKTLTTQMVARRLLEEKEIDVVIVIAPKGNLYDPWAMELDRERFSYAVLDGTRAEDDATIRSREYEVLLVNYERVGKVLDAITETYDMSRVGVIADETYAIKNAGSGRSAAFLELTGRYELAFLTGLNGTPGEQGPHDLWAFYRAMDFNGLLWGFTFDAYADANLDKIGTRYTVSDPLKQQLLISRTSIRYTAGEADQFSGKDKSFRYVSLQMTAEQRRASRDIVNGFIQDSDGDIEFISKNILSIYLRLREVCCGYDKFSSESGEFYRARHTVDSKILWLECALEADRSGAWIVFCEFNEQEDRIKEMLDRIGIKWSSTRGSPSKRSKSRLPQQDRIPDYVRRQLYAFLVRSNIEYPGEWDNLRYFAPAIEWMSSNHPYLLDYYEVMVKGPKYDPHRRAQEIADFNEGRTQVFILKSSEGRGISLNRRAAALSGAGGRPSMAIMAPTWSMGTFDQQIERAMDTDPETKKSTHTTIYVLTVRGSIEDRMLSALRSRKEIQEVLLQDRERKGYHSFLMDLADGNAHVDAPASANDGGFVEFDSEEMYARITCGVPPYSKLTDKLIQRKMLDKYRDEVGVNSFPKLEAWFRSDGATGNIIIDAASGTIEDLDKDLEFDGDVSILGTEIKDNSIHSRRLLLSRAYDLLIKRVTK